MWIYFNKKRKRKDEYIHFSLANNKHLHLHKVNVENVNSLEHGPICSGFCDSCFFFSVSQLVSDMCEIKRETGLAFSQMEKARWNLL